MYRIINISLFVISLLLYGCLKNELAKNADLSTPEAAIEVRYRALRLSDLGLFKKSHLDIHWINKEDFLKISSSLAGYKILKKQVMKGDKFSKEGDIYILVEEKYKNNNKLGHMNYVLRKINSNWLIVSFNAEEEEPINPKVIEKQAKP
jgi:hypothetical protein